MISFDTLQARILRAYRKHNTWRAVGDEYGINAGTAWDIAHGYEPKTPHLRAHLDLPALAPAPVCVKCGEIHVTRRCTKNGNHHNPRRIAIRLDDPASAAASILKHMEPDKMDVLLEYLREK